MSGCQIKIITESGGERSLFEAAGVFEREDAGERVRYAVDGDDGELFFSKSRFEMCRRGKCGIEATFCEGKETRMILGDHVLHGSIPVRTTRYLLQKEGKKRNIELCYELFAAEHIQTFSLKIQVCFSEEK